MKITDILYQANLGAKAALRTLRMEIVISKLYSIESRQFGGWQDGVEVCL